MGLDFRSVYQELRKQHGEQDWWPGDNAFEIMIGAILTQNTAWTNVEKALANLKQAGVLSCFHYPGYWIFPGTRWRS